MLVQLTHICYAAVSELLDVLQCLCNAWYSFDRLAASKQMPWCMSNKQGRLLHGRREGPWCWRQPVSQCACQQQEQQRGCGWKQKTSSGQSLYPVGQHNMHVSTQLGILQSVHTQPLLNEVTKAIVDTCLHPKYADCCQCCPW